VIQFATDLRQVGGFFSGTPVSSHHDIAKILLQVALSTTILTITPILYCCMVTSDIKIKHKPFVFVVFVRTNVQEKLEDTNMG
jgi:hypothetical protein